MVTMLNELERTDGRYGLQTMCSSSIHIASLRDEHVNHLAVLVNGAVDVAPLPGDFHVGLVDEPTRTNAASTRPRGFDE